MAGLAALPGVDPSRVNTPDELAACLDGLRRRRGLSYEAMEKAATTLSSRPGGARLEPLGKSTVGEIVTGKRLPTKGKLRTFLAVCKVAPEDLAQWLAAWERAGTADLARPVGAVRVRDVRPRLLGVHDAIQVEEDVPGELPVYVPRDIDDGLRAELAANAQQGCFVLLIGGSSVGKTRTLYEAVLAVLPDWWLVHPDDAEAVRRLADAPTPRTVVWLDELQRYLGPGAGLSAGTARCLLRAGRVLAATIWPDEYGIRIAPRQAGHGDPYASDRGLLDLAKNFDVADAFTNAENHRAQELVGFDGRIRRALGGLDGGLTQVLAAGPQLVRWWEQAHNPYAKAIITAAVDARRLGVESPVTKQFLAGAVHGYLTPTQRATAPADWIERALDYATTPLHGAASTLSPVDNATIGRTEGYVAADYLLQHSRRTRRGELAPTSLWEALTANTISASALIRLGQAAKDRGLYRHAAALWTTASTLGSIRAACLLITHLHQIIPPDATRAARWAVDHVSLDERWAAFELLRVLRMVEADDAVTALAARAARHVSLDQPIDVLRLQREVGAHDAARTLAAQAARHANLDDPGNVAALLKDFREAGTSEAVQALLSRDPANHVSLADPGNVAMLLRELRAAGDSDAVGALLSRDPANHVSLADPGNVAALLGELRAAGDSDAVRALLARDPADHVSLGWPRAVAWLLGALRAAGADDAARTLAARAARHASLDHPRATSMMLTWLAWLRAAGADDAARILAARAARHASLDDPLHVAALLRELRAAGDGDAVQTLLARDPAGHTRLDDWLDAFQLLRALRESGAGDALQALATRVGRQPSLSNPGLVATLLGELRAAGADDAARTLAARASRHASLDDPLHVAVLLEELRAAGDSDAVQALLARGPADHASLGNPGNVAALLRALRAAGDSDAVQALLARDPADHASLDDRRGVAALVKELRVGGASDAARALAAQAANAGMFDVLIEAYPHEASRYRFGREPNGTPSESWKWQEPNQPQPPTP